MPGSNGSNGRGPRGGSNGGAPSNGNGHGVDLDDAPAVEGLPPITRAEREARARVTEAMEVAETASPPTEMERLVRRQLELLGEAPDRAGLRRTPKRVADSMRWLTRGYAQDVREVVGGGIFEEAHESMVLVRDVELYSLCEHHMLPFFGKAHVAYIPNGRILGLSKIPRVVDVFARRLQVQERLTEQVADAFVELLEPKGVGVVIEAQHLCMMMRGVEKQNSSTVTSALRGTLRDCPMSREEFLRLVHRRD